MALGGTFAVWLLHTSVDWVYNMPGLTGMALLSAAGLCALAAVRAAPASAAAPRPGSASATAPGHGAPPEPASASTAGPASASASGRPALDPVPAAGAGCARPPGPRVVLAWTLAVIALVAVGAPSLVRQYLAQQRSDSAGQALPADPQKALRETASSLQLNDSRLETYYTRAAAFARLGDYPDARDTLLEAVRLEPLNAVPWALLGDLATRRGDATAAAQAYQRARALDPGDAALFNATPPAAG